jgi:hypothetical protein
VSRRRPVLGVAGLQSLLNVDKVYDKGLREWPVWAAVSREAAHSTQRVVKTYKQCARTGEGNLQENTRAG